MKFAFPGFRIATVDDIQPSAEVVTLDTVTNQVRRMRILDSGPKVWFEEEGGEMGWSWASAFIRPHDRFIRMVPA